MGYGPWSCKELDTTERLTCSCSKYIPPRVIIYKGKNSDFTEERPGWYHLNHVLQVNLTSDMGAPDVRAVTSVGFLPKMNNLNLKLIWQMEPLPHTCSFPFQLVATLGLQLLKLKSTTYSSLFLTLPCNPFKKYAGCILYSPYTQDSIPRI